MDLILHSDLLVLTWFYQAQFLWYGDEWESTIFLKGTQSDQIKEKNYFL